MLLKSISLVSLYFLNMLLKFLKLHLWLALYFYWTGLF